MENNPWLQILRDALMTGRPPQEWPQSGEDAAAWQTLVEEMLSLYAFIDALSRGNLGQELRMRGPMAGSLKMLQANLRHLTWQVQQVAAGNLKQRVDFMGEFSEAFNSMVDNLAHTQAAERDQRALAEALRDTAAALNSARSLEEVFDAILANLGKVVAHDAVDILLIEDDYTARVARFAGLSDASPEELEEFARLRLPIDRTHNLKEMMASGQPCLVGDLKAYDWVTTGATSEERSYLGAPVRVKNETVGFLGVFSKEVNFFTPHHSQRLMAFADQAAIAIEKARLFDKLQLQATIDMLTGVSNRRHFIERAEEELERARRYQKPLSALMLDIDHFKRVNDIYGHAAGDQVLVAVAQNCKGSLRNADLFGRYGGEEFAAILPETSLEGALILADRLRSSVAHQTISILNEKIKIAVTISVGVAEFSSDIPSLLVLLDQADQALYDAKQKGRNRVESYKNNPEM